MILRFYRHWRSSYAGIPRLIWFLSLVQLVNRCGGMVIAFIMLYLTEYLHYDIRHAGFVMSFYGVGALIGNYMGGWLTDRIGFYRVQLASLILNGLVLLVMMTVRDMYLMCATAFALSISSEVFRPANSVAIAKFSDPENRTRSISLQRMAFNIGWTIAPVFGGLLVLLGWKWLFWVDGLTCIAAAFLLTRLIPMPKDQVEVHKKAQEKNTASVSPFLDRNYMLFMLLTVFNAIIFMQIMWTVPTFFKSQFGWSEAMIGMISAVNGLLVFSTEMPIIFRMEGRKTALYCVRIGLVLYGLAYLMFVLPAAPLVAALLYMLFISYGEIFVMPFSSNYVYGRMGANKQGQYIAVYSMTYSLANILAPLLGTQIIAAWGYQTLWSGVAGMSVLVLLGVWLLEKKTAGNDGLPQHKGTDAETVLAEEPQVL